MTFYIPILMIGAAAAAALFIVYAEISRRKFQIQYDLGLLRGKLGEKKTPFYKWGWRKQHNERVWAERIVKDAFRKAGLWLSDEDLAFFEEQCVNQSQGKEVGEDAILGRIGVIAARMTHIRRNAAEAARKIYADAANANENTARAYLISRGAQPESGKALQRFCVHKLRRCIEEYGKAMVGLEAVGVPVFDSKGETVFTLKGMNAWSMWIGVFSDACLKEPSIRIPNLKQNLLKFIHRTVAAGLFKDYSDDVRHFRDFRFTVSEDISRNEIGISMDRIERAESIFYHWKFTESIPFNHADHKRIREMLVRKDLAPSFRELAVNSFKPGFSSVRALFDMFPSRVIFYGRNDNAREFASEQYLHHLMQLKECIGPLAGAEDDGPQLIVIDAEKFYQLVRQNEEILSEMMKFSKKRGFKSEAEMIDPSYVLDLIDEEKEVFNRKRGLYYEGGEALGWIVNIPISDQTPEAFVAMGVPPYDRYARFNCDGGSDVDFFGATHGAKKSRIQFFSMVLDLLLRRPDESQPPESGPDSGGEEGGA